MQSSLQLRLRAVSFTLDGLGYLIVNYLMKGTSNGAEMKVNEKIGGRCASEQASRRVTRCRGQAPLYVYGSREPKFSSEFEDFFRHLPSSGLGSRSCESRQRAIRRVGRIKGCDACCRSRSLEVEGDRCGAAKVWIAKGKGRGIFFEWWDKMRAGRVDMSYLARMDEEAAGGTNERADDED